MSPEEKRILVIDDQKDTRDLIAETLKNNEFEVLTAPGGREGIQIAKLKQPDVILLDMEMPRYNGIDTCIAIKRIPRIKNIPIIFLTAHKDKEIVTKAIQAGGTDYIVKPFDPDDLISRITNAFKKQKEEFDPSAVVKNKKQADDDSQNI